jgi:carboxyl-terminal processing protease
MEDKLIKYAESEGIEYVDADYKTSKEMIYMLFKAYIARDIWDTSQFYHIYNQSDPVFKKALEVIEHESMYEAKLRDYRKN